MNKAAQFSAQLSKLDVQAGLTLVEAQADKAVHFDVIDEVMCLMHADGSVNMISQVSGVGMAVEAISAANILRVLKHYRPFSEVFSSPVH